MLTARVCTDDMPSSCKDKLEQLSCDSFSHFTVVPLSLAMFCTVTFMGSAPRAHDRGWHDTACLLVVENTSCLQKGVETKTYVEVVDLG